MWWFLIPWSFHDCCHCCCHQDSGNGRRNDYEPGKSLEPRRPWIIIDPRYDRSVPVLSEEEIRYRRKKEEKRRKRMRRKGYDV